MGFLSKLFGVKEVHVYLHVDGEIAVTSETSKSISREAELAKQIVDMNPELENIQIPIIEFGSDVEDNNSEKV